MRYLLFFFCRNTHRRLWRMLLLPALLFTGASLFAQEARWIWYPGDFDIWLANNMQNRRTERGSFFPPFWKLDNPYNLVTFQKKFSLAQPEEISIYAEGQYNVKLDEQLVHGTPQRLSLPAGNHVITLKVFCSDRVPALLVKGNNLISDTSWRVTFEDKEWIDASGKVSDQSGTTWMAAAAWDFSDPLSPPGAYRLPVRPQPSAAIHRTVNGWLADFGKETFGYIRLHGVKGQGRVQVYYGESKEEALSTASCETLDQLDMAHTGAADTVLRQSKAFRYVYVQADAGMSLDSVSMLYEFAPVHNRGSFRCSDEAVNKIWDVAAYTLHLNTREFFIDGIKRDRWIWSGDACQSFLMNYYLFFDSSTVTRTLFALRGKDPVTSHINTILDYTFYWFLGIYDYYRYTGDAAFIRQCYPRMQSMIEYCLSRRNANGMMEGLAGDWVFIDWASGLDKKGEVSFEQLLFCRSLETMSLCAAMVNDSQGAERYRALAATLKDKLFAQFWSNGRHALLHNRINGRPTSQVTRYANMFALFFGYLDSAKTNEVKQYVLLNREVPRITTPYMRFYELEALCVTGAQEYVLNEIKNYWGGMLQAGATSFWEEYDPAKQGAAHYAMYGRPFGKSLCHAWGASPIYLLGRYYLGVSPLAPGYSRYQVQPVLGGLQWMEGDVPTPKGQVHVYCSTNRITVKAVEGNGLLRFRSKTKPVAAQGKVQAKGNHWYELPLDGAGEYQVQYTAM